MGVGVLDHYNVWTTRLDETVRFYENALGLESGPRPAFPFPGAWLYSEGKPVVHLVDATAKGGGGRTDTGVIHHVAFVSRGFEAMKERLASGGYEFEAREVPGGELWQLFVRDPNGVLVELNFEVAKER